ncbi:T9SS type A sorting domain-containing protein [candidate division KSB1 bacterium]|nr:T9SS type A sorting domain-containing protein [candidate division KSB1 bacterium]
MLRRVVMSLYFVIFGTVMCLGQENVLTIQEVRQTWRSGTGTIEEAVISVRPRGIYMEYGLYLTFSARGLGFSSNDSLEIVFRFNLPEESVIHDSWLWVNEEIIRGEIMDRWTASAIYEDIVRRQRKDPSILYKNGSSSYELRIFPMAANSTRKVKITYLAPALWSARSVLASLPTHLLRISKNQVKNFYVLTWLDDKWQNPRLHEFPHIPFIPKYEETLGFFLRAAVPAEATQSALHFTLDAPYHNGIYLSTYENNGRNYYQLAFLPSAVLDFKISKKTLVLLSFHNGKSTIDQIEFLQNIESQLKAQLAPQDFYNVIYNDNSGVVKPSGWLEASSGNLTTSFLNINENMSIGGKTDELLLAGVDYIQNNGNDAGILFVSNSDDIRSLNLSNSAIEKILGRMDTIIPIHIVDCHDRDMLFTWIGGRNYYGNDYFYTNLTRKTSACYYSIQAGYSFLFCLSSVLQLLDGFIKSFDIHTSMENGFCYDRYTRNINNPGVYLQRPVTQIGKFSGSSPFDIEISGIYDGELFKQKTEIPSIHTFSCDSLAEEIWAGYHISVMESQQYSNEIVDEIVRCSLEHRVLSIYTAFLCLEPSRGGKICYGCIDEATLPVHNLTDEAEPDSLFQAFPNPFNDHTALVFQSNKRLDVRNASFRIFNITGQVVRTFVKPSEGEGNFYRFIWNGTDDKGSPVSSGHYFFVVRTAERQYVIKLMLIR